MEEAWPHGGKLPASKEETRQIKNKEKLCVTWDEKKGSESEEDPGNEEAMWFLMAIEEDIKKYIKQR